MKQTLIYGARIVNEGLSFVGAVLLKNDRIDRIYNGDVPQDVLKASQVVDAHGLWLIPGAIDDHVHFRDPGLTHKADLRTESMAALAGGVTSFMDMPNTQPMTTSIQAWEAKMELAAEKSLANYAFYLGATNDNLDELLLADYSRVCGIKVFMGSSTGNMLVGKKEALEALFSAAPALLAVHAESEAIIAANKQRFLSEVVGELSVHYHPLIRSEEACYASSSLAVDLATRFGARLHLLHLSTEKELSLVGDGPLASKKITAEVCLPHLWFDQTDYTHFGNAIKCNPAIKQASDKEALRKAVQSGRVDVVATDHAPHLWAEKQGDCLTAASGMPGIQFSVSLMMDLAAQGAFTPETVVQRMCHAPAELFRIEARGFIREGYYADLVLLDPNERWVLTGDRILSKCGWSPYEENVFGNRVKKTWVNGVLAYDEGTFTEQNPSTALRFRA